MTELHTLRQDLAAAFRWAARMGMHESIANHFSVATDASGSRFLLNPVGAHFSRMRASDLMLIDLAHPENLQGDDAPDPPPGPCMRRCTSACRRHAASCTPTCRKPRRCAACRILNF